MIFFPSSNKLIEFTNLRESVAHHNEPAVNSEPGGIISFLISKCLVRIYGAEPLKPHTVFGFRLKWYVVHFD